MHETLTESEAYSDSSNGANLPEALPRSERFTRLHEDIRTSHELDFYIAERLCKGPKQPSPKQSDSPTPTLGSIYVYFLAEHEGFVKIGSTARRREVRRKEISPRNRYGVLRCHLHERQRPFPNWILAEYIIKEELYNVRHESNYTEVQPKKKLRTEPRSKVATKQESGRTEWYKIGESHANEVVDKWRDWLDFCDPYDRNGSLTAFWQNAIEHREKYDEKKHGDMHSRWSAILKPPSPGQLTWFRVKQVLLSQKRAGRYLLDCLRVLLSCPLPLWLMLTWFSYVAYGLLGGAGVVVWMLLRCRAAF